MGAVIGDGDPLLGAPPSDGIGRRRRDHETAEDEAGERPDHCVSCEA
jgi:hypothetical protein